MRILKYIWGLIVKIVYFFVFNIFKLNISYERVDKILQFIKFSLVGLSNTVIHYIVYFVCNLSGLHYMLSNFVAFTISVLNSFFWNNKYVFKSTDNRDRNGFLRTFLKTYIAYSVTGLFLNSLLLFLEVDILNINVYVAPIINLFITTPVNFLLNKFWAYKK